MNNNFENMSEDKLIKKELEKMGFQNITDCQKQIRSSLLTSLNESAQSFRRRQSIYGGTLSQEADKAFDALTPESISVYSKSDYYMFLTNLPKMLACTIDQQGNVIDPPLLEAIVSELEASFPRHELQNYGGPDPLFNNLSLIAKITDNEKLAKHLHEWFNKYLEDNVKLTKGLQEEHERHKGLPFWKGEHAGLSERLRNSGLALEKNILDVFRFCVLHPELMKQLIEHMRQNPWHAHKLLDEVSEKEIPQDILSEIQDIALSCKKEEED